MASRKTASRKKGGRADRKPRSHRLSVRVDENLWRAAKGAAEGRSDSEVVRLALTKLAAQDNYWTWLLTRPEKLDPEFEFEF